MSIETARKFVNDIARDPALQRRFAAALEGKEPHQYGALLADFGRMHGFDFSAEDVEGLTQQVRTRAGVDGELSDEALEAVTGGTQDQCAILCDVSLFGVRAPWC